MRTESERLSRPVAFRLTQSDYKKWLEKVESSGRKPSEFFRDCVLQNRTQVVARTGEQMQILRLVSAASNNINQLARAANSARLSGAVSETLYAGMLAELQAISDELKGRMRNAD